MLQVPGGGDFRWNFHSHGTTRPATSLGTLVTASGSTHTKGSWANVITTPTEHDTYMIVININNGAVSASNRQSLLDIGIDEAGGSSYSVKIPNLYTAGSGPYNVGSAGCWFIFPLFIPAGSTFGARMQSATASATASVNIQLFGRPTRPENIRVGHFVEAIGVNTGTSAGTTVTPGTTSEGAWASMGSPTRDLWWWQMGWGQSDTTVGGGVLHLDAAAGDVSNKKMLLEHQVITTTTSEQQYNLPTAAGCYGNVDASSTIYARAQSSTTAETGSSAVVYGLGG